MRQWYINIIFSTIINILLSFWIVLQKFLRCLMSTLCQTLGVPQGYSLVRCMNRTFNQKHQGAMRGAGLRQARGQPGMEAGGGCHTAVSCASAGWRSWAFERTEHRRVFLNLSPWRCSVLCLECSHEGPTWRPSSILPGDEEHWAVCPALPTPFCFSTWHMAGPYRSAQLSLSHWSMDPSRLITSVHNAQSRVPVAQLVANMYFWKDYMKSLREGWSTFNSAHQGPTAPLGFKPVPREPFMLSEAK